MWSFDAKLRSTFALLLCRASPRTTVQFMDRALAQYKTYILAPTMLGYVLSMAVFMRIERLSEEHEQLRRIERDTGFAYEGRPQATARHNVRQLTLWLQKSGHVVISAASCKRDLLLISDVLDYVMTSGEACGGRRDSAATPTEAEAETRARRCTTALLQAVPPLLGRKSAHENYVDYLKLRAERLSTTASHSARVHRLPLCFLFILHFLGVAEAANRLFLYALSSSRCSRTKTLPRAPSWPTRAGRWRRRPGATARP